MKPRVSQADTETTPTRPIRCPSCREPPKDFVEVWDSMTIVFDCIDGNARSTSGTLVNNGSPTRVRARCGCGVEWVLRGVRQIGDIDLMVAALPPVWTMPPEVEAIVRCRKYVGDNDATTPQLTCLRPRGHDGLCDNIIGDDDQVDVGIRRDTDMHVLELCPVAECAHGIRSIDVDTRIGRCHGGHAFRWSPR